MRCWCSWQPMSLKSLEKDCWSGTSGPLSATTTHARMQERLIPRSVRHRARVGGGGGHEGQNYWISNFIASLLAEFSELCALSHTQKRENTFLENTREFLSSHYPRAWLCLFSAFFLLRVTPRFLSNIFLWIPFFISVPRFILKWREGQIEKLI